LNLEINGQAENLEMRREKQKKRVPGRFC